MGVKAKEIIDGKFWILEDTGQKVATLSLSDEKYLLSDAKGTRFFDKESEVTRDIGKPIEWNKLDITVLDSKEVHGYPTSNIPYNTLYDVKNRLPLFTKSFKSKSLYCAGYYIIKFDKGWVKSFCPKLVTLETYDYKGPFKQKLEMREALGKANAKRSY